MGGYAGAGQMKPLKITAYFLTPPAMGHICLHFDGVLAHILAREKTDFWNLPEEVVQLDLELPLKRIQNADGDFFWCASALLFPEWYVSVIYKRFEVGAIDYLSDRKKQINVGSGKFRHWFISMPYSPIPEGVFYAYGDRKEIERLLPHITSLGKKGAVGYGFVREWKVEEIEEDCSVVKDGVAMRPIPIWAVEEAENQVIGTYKPPYWDRSGAGIVVPAGAKVRLKDGCEVA
jgi:CRISPR type IV-associated protein Csf3